MPTNLKNYKEEKRTALLRALSLLKSTRAIVILYVSDQTVQVFLEEAGKSIGVAIVPDTKENREGADIFITDNWSLAPTKDLFSSVVVPIWPLQWSHEVWLTEFNPMKFEWNAFLFENVDKYQIFASLVRYLENVKYPGDKRTLLKNLGDTK